MYSEKEKRTVSTSFLFFIALFFAGASGFIYISNHTVVTQKTVATETIKPKKLNPVDLHLSQYSDRYITKNAIDTNDAYSHLALADYMTEYSTDSIISTKTQVAGAGLALLKQSTQKEYGTWIWTPVFDMEEPYIKSVLDGAQKNGINAIYVSVDSYLDIYVMPHGPEKEKKKKLFTEKLEYFITEANKRNIAVDAEAGWRNWAEDGNAYKAFAIINFIKEFNRTEKYTFRGFQYDVEPYLLGSYQTEPVLVLKKFLILIDQSITLLGPQKTERDLKFSIVIPDFYDKDQSPVSAFVYNNEILHAYDHLLNILEKRPNSSIVVMSYRNFSHGTDGTVDISTTEIDTATNGIYSTHIIIAQETGDVLPPYITFNNTNRDYYLQEKEKIIKAFTPYENFGGIAVHYVNAYLELK